MSRRGALSAGAFAAVAVAVQPVSAKFVEPEEGAVFTSKQKLKAELAAAAATRTEEERIAALPITKLKVVRDKIAEGSVLVDRGNWDELRARIELQEVNDVVKRAVPYQSPASQDVAALKTKLLAQLRPVDEFAYKQQKEEFMPSILKDYCAPGVVPRDEPGACKLRPVLDKVPAQARLKDAVATLDAIIKALS